MAKKINYKSILKWDNLIYLLAFFAPLSLDFFFLDGRLSLSIPLEPLLIFCCGVFLIKLCFDKKYDKAALFHPISFFLMLYVCWLFITSLTSEIPLVSIKQWMSKIWFVIPAYFMTIVLFTDTKNSRKFAWSYLLALLLVVCYTLINLFLVRGYSFRATYAAMQPFFTDHTIYAAVIALFLPLSLYFCLRKTDSKAIRLLAFVSFLILLAGLILSFTRAAWVSVFIALIVFILIMLGVKFKWLASIAALSIVLLFAFRTPIINHLQSNTTDRSENFAEQIKSITNISTSASNLERINRWKVGWQMFREAPFFGKGPGTYQFLYGPYQNYEDLNAGSTKQGNLGKIENEYFGVLVDSGVIGLLLFLGLMIAVFRTLRRLIKNSPNKDDRWLAIALCVSLTTYYVHVLFNNYWHTDKLAVPLFAFMAMAASLDIKSAKETAIKTP